MTNGFDSGIESYQIDKGAGGYNEQVAFSFKRFNTSK
jgi:hypothetical protein